MKRLALLVWFLSLFATLAPSLASAQGTGQFRVQNGQVIDPRGNAFVAHGINVDFDQLSVAITDSQARPLTTYFGGTPAKINFIRVPVRTSSGIGTASAVYPNPATWAQQVAWATANGIVVEFEDHDCNGGLWEDFIPGGIGGQTCIPPTGGALTTMLNFWKALATQYKSNPYVWIGSLNEINSGDGTYSQSAISAVTVYQNALYQAVRGVGFNNIIQMGNGLGGGNAGTVGINSGQVVATIAGWTNITWYMHGYYTNGTPSGALSYLQGSTAACCGGSGSSGYLGARTLQSGDGVVPIIYDECGSGTGSTSNGDASSLVSAFGTVQAQGVGFACWLWWGTPSWIMVNNGQTSGGPFSLTVWGQQISTLISQQSVNPTGSSSSESPNNTTVTTVGPTITDSFGNVFSISSGAQIVINGAVDGTTSNVVELAYVNHVLWQLNAAGNWYNYLGTPGSYGGPTTISPISSGTKIPVPAPLTGSVSTQTWVAYDKSFSGITLACGKPFHFQVLPPPQYNPTAYLYPLYIWLHPDYEADPWYYGGNTNPLFLSNVEPGSYNTVPFLTAHPAFYVAPYADQTNGNGSGCSGDGNDAVQNWGGWFNNGSVGSGTHYSGDTGPNTFAIIQMILFLESTYSIDPNRIYCNGFSLGGIGCEYLMQNYNAYNGTLGRYFAAGASQAGVNQANTPVTTATANLMRNVPTWYFSGAGDGASPPGAYNTPLCSALGGNPSSLTGITSATANQCGTSAMRYTLCPTCGHQNTDAGGNPVWTNTTINNFLFSQSASGGVTPPPAEVITVSTIATQTSATPFTVSGTISGLTTAPTLQYSVNGGTWLSLPPSSGSRDPYNQPGSNASVWNTPFGSGAIWSNAYHSVICYDPPGGSGPCNAYINPVNNFGNTLYTSSSASDPTFTFSGPNGRTIAPDNGATLTATMHVPTGAYTPGPYSGGDNPFTLQDKTNFPNRQYTWSGITPSVQPPGLQAGQGPFTATEGGEWDDITSDRYGEDYDTGLSGYNVGAGMIVGCDTNPACNPFFPQIKHGLRYVLDVTQFASNSTVPGGQVLNPSGWPDRLQDAQSGGNVYHGSLPFGTTLGIPSTTAMPAGLDANCQGMFWTMQHYPLIPRDVAGGGFHLAMDQNAVSSAYGQSVTACLPTLVNLLQVLTNQHQGGQDRTTNPANGPGARIDTGPLALGTGSGTTSVTATSYFFTVPGLAAGAANTISVRDANATSTFGTSNTFIVTGATGPTVGAPLSPGFVSTSGSQFLDGSGNRQRLACTGYGNPTSNVAGDMSIIQAQGFNCISVPWFDKTTCAGGTCNFAAFDTIVSAANALSLRVVFVHQGNEGVNGTGSCTTQQANGLWYDQNGASPWNATNGTDGCGTAGTVSYAQFKSNWVQFATHYSGNPAVIGFDLHNEPTTFGNPACCATSGGGGTGTFQIVGGKIITPTGAVFKAAGPNIYWQPATMAQLCPTSACSKLLSDFPNINFIRVVWENGYNTSGMEPYIGWLTALGIVVEICDFNQSPSAPPVSGSTLTQSINWYSTLAQTYKNNPYVWYESQNEMYGAGATMASNQQQLYNAVRAQTSTGIVVFGLPGGGNIGTVGTSGSVNGSTMTASVYAPMHNIIWDLHFYAYVVNNIVGSYSTDIPTIQNVLNGSVAGAYGIFATQSIRSADGLVPVIIGEVGNSTTGQSLDPNGSQVVQAAATDTNAQGFGAYAVGTYAIGITCCNALSDSNQNLTSPYGVFVNNLVQQNSSGRGGTGVGAVGAGWGTGTGGDVRAMANDVGAAIQAADPGVLVLVEGPLNNGSLFNGTARGSSSFPITAGSISDLSSVGTLPVTCCAGHLGYVVHDTPTSLSGVAPDSGNGATTMRNTAWGYLITQGRAPVWIGKMGASLDGTNGSLADETGWATSLTQYMNGQLGAQGGPTFSGCTMPMSGDWFNYGYLPSQQPDGTLNQNNSNKSGQQGYWSTLLYTTCTGGGGGVGATTWNPNDVSPSISLSPDNLIATMNGTGSNSVRSTTSQSTGRICFAAVATTISSNWDIGIANSTYNLEGGGGLGVDGNGIGFDPRSAGGLQGIFFNNALLSSGAGTSPNGEEEMICADLDAKLLWATNATMRGNGNPWNNSPTANPATGTGGLSFAGLTCPCFITWNEEEAGVATLNAAGPFAVSIPSGFSAWQQPITSGGRVILLNFAN